MFKIENEFKGANISRTIRFTEKIFEQLNQIATENEISFNLLVLQCCKYALDHSESKKMKTDGFKNKKQKVTVELLTVTFCFLFYL